MTTIRRRPLILAALAAPAIAHAQGTRRPLRIIIPFPPGGAVDSLGRVLADRLAPVLDQSVVVDNRSGAGGLIGADAVAKGPPDGTMLGIIGAATLCAAPFLQQSMPFDVQRDLRAVTQITDSAVLLVVNAARAQELGWTDLASVLAWAKANPGRLRVAHSGVATVSHLTLSAVAAAAGVEITGVPYRGGAQATSDVVSGVIEGSADLPTALMPHVEAGRLRALGVSSGRSLSLLPDVPPMAAAPGLAAIDIRSWNAIMLPAATPPAEVRRLFDAIRRVAAEPSFAAALRPLGYDAVTSASPDAMTAMIAAETPRWRSLVEMSGAKVD
ncbi:Bug family tripartite tricarboxylate transporter substrate binding protein [Humitalea sp. 24SJ18S-53]|uniref:Bug family tripartite tricarboxylate transporter substrate binding protein n=1 Tax=Humitalea sp. 24SJ18S-53 TaxID=3422307 RepID=UPI003D66EB0D